MRKWIFGCLGLVLVLGLVVVGLIIFGVNSVFTAGMEGQEASVEKVFGETPEGYEIAFEGQFAIGMVQALMGDRAANFAMLKNPENNRMIMTMDMPYSKERYTEEHLEKMWQRQKREMKRSNPQLELTRQVHPYHIDGQAFYVFEANMVSSKQRSNITYYIVGFIDDDQDKYDSMDNLILLMLMDTSKRQDDDQNVTSETDKEALAEIENIILGTKLKNRLDKIFVPQEAEDETANSHE